MNILLVEDNELIARGLAYAFEKNGYAFSHSSTVMETVEHLRVHPDTDLVILDILLPDGNGFDLYKKEIKKRGIPAIFLTARDDEDDVVRGLDIGAEDYVTKPFSTKELMARVSKALLRSNRQRLIRVRDITFDADKLVICRGEQQVDLTPLELKLIQLLFMNLNKLVSRNTILEKIWEWTGNDVDDHTVTVYMRRIREKLGTDIITTVKGMGYRIDEQ